MEKIIYIGFFLLVLATVTYSQNKCEHPKCPADCEFGVTHEKQNGTCQKCVCSKSPCETVKCANGTVCRVRHQHKDHKDGKHDHKGHKHHKDHKDDKHHKDKKDKECKGNSCSVKHNVSPVAVCVEANKPGACPAIKASKHSKACKIDADCLGDAKCCNSACQGVCRKTACKCYSGSHIEYYNNSRGCPVCKCSKDIKNNQCKLAKDVGPCRASIPKFYYDNDAKSCKEFKYGGCGGNENKFDTLEECNKRCQPEPTPKASNDTTCSQPKQPGRCEGAFTRYHFDSNTTSCQQFIYGGCGGNDNNFETKEACEAKCGKDAKDEKDGKHKHGKDGKHKHDEKDGKHKHDDKDGKHKHGDKDGKHKHNEKAPNKCSLPMAIGNCKALLPKFYFDSNSSECKKFNYGGCGGNDNRFDSLEQCNKECSSKKDDNKKPSDDKKAPEDKKAVNRNETKSEDVCKLPSESGVCRGFFKRYFFDTQSNSCEEFIYGGCGGNQNNFETEEACEARCENKTAKCSLPMVVGNCKGLIPRFYFDSVSKTCKPFNYGGCGGNDNRFESADECARDCLGKPKDNKQPPKDDKKAANGTAPQDICKLPKERGPCRAAFPRFYFDTTSNSCQEFIYGGCGGNDNRFDTIDQCSKECVKKQDNMKPQDDKNKGDDKKAAEDICSLPAEKGKCRGAFKKYFFDTKSNSCKEFLYGGCGGNGNQFEKIEDCENKCKKAPEQKKSDTKKADDKKASNETEFDSIHKLVNPSLKSAANVDDVCSLPKVPGKCRGFFSRYYFDTKEGVCKHFIYGGCDANGNNFETIEECKTVCMREDDDYVDDDDEEYDAGDD